MSNIRLGELAEWTVGNIYLNDTVGHRKQIAIMYAFSQIFSSWVGQNYVRAGGKSTLGINERKVLKDFLLCLLLQTHAPREPFCSKFEASHLHLWPPLDQGRVTGSSHVHIKTSPLLYSRSSLVFHFKYGNVYLSTPNSLTVPSPQELCSMLCGSLDGRGTCGRTDNMYMYGWVPLLSPWNYHSIVNQL